MADTGTKTYLAKESSAQKILTLLDNVATNEDVSSVADIILTTGLSVEPPRGYGVSNWQTGTLAYSQTETVEVTGSGIVYFSSRGRWASNSNLMWGRIYIDGTEIRPYIGNDSWFVYQFEFTKSLKLQVLGDTSLYYLIGLR